MPPEPEASRHPDVRVGSSAHMDIDTHEQPDSSSVDTTIIATLKRRASCTFEEMNETSSRKRLKEDSEDTGQASCKSMQGNVDGKALADDLEQELQCGCCSALIYRPVVVSPCQHFFCGSCVVLWIKNGGTNCPACRGVSIGVSPSRPLQIMADILVRADPSRARSVPERMQADEIYRSGLSIRIPTPRVASPEPNIPASNSNYVYPCPHCLAGNQWGWRCPQPISDPDADPDSAWHAEDGSPPGHAYCGNCENVLSLQAPTTSKCDFCQVSFCGIGIPGRCVAAPLLAQHLHGMSDLGDLIQCGEVYDSFEHNTVEVDIMLDYLTAQGLTPRHIYREIIGIILRSRRQFAPLFEQDLFADVHGVSGGVDPDPTAPRVRICRLCATEVLLWGLREWWVQERKKGFLEEDVMKRPDCPESTACTRQKDHAHAKEFNHIISTPDPIPVPPPEVQPDLSAEGQNSQQSVEGVQPPVAVTEQHLAQQHELLRQPEPPIVPPSALNPEHELARSGIAAPRSDIELEQLPEPISPVYHSFRHPSSDDLAAFAEAMVAFNNVVLPPPPIAYRAAESSSQAESDVFPVPSSQDQVEALL